MSNEIFILLGTAATIGFVHTILGPDHYLPFIVLSKARGWSIVKTLLVTFLCGIGHILSSVILGLIGIIFGIVIFKLEAIESLRGELAAWFLLIFGFVYFLWGLKRTIWGQSHEHFHKHKNGKIDLHSHNHISDHLEIYASKSENLTPWILFIIFVFGPCEALIPILIYPAVKLNMIAIWMVTFIFGLTTILTMLGIVSVSFYGLSKLPVHRFEKYSHAIAGLTIFLCGAAMKFLGL